MGPGQGPEKGPRFPCEWWFAMHLTVAWGPLQVPGTLPLTHRQTHRRLPLTFRHCSASLSLAGFFSLSLAQWRSSWV